MKVYVASKWEKRSIARRIMDRIEKSGHEIACDWTVHDGHERERYAIEDINGVRACDILFAYMDGDECYKGVMCEIGAAIALNKPVVVFGGTTSIFMDHPNVKKFTYSYDALNYILRGEWMNEKKSSNIDSQ